jgi:hypothetical protein
MMMNAAPQVSIYHGFEGPNPATASGARRRRTRSASRCA